METYRVFINDYYKRLFTIRKVITAIGYILAIGLLFIGGVLMAEYIDGSFMRWVLNVAILTLILIILREIITTFTQDQVNINTKTVDKLKDVYYYDDAQGNYALPNLYILAHFINTDESTHSELVFDIPINLKPITNSDLQDENIKNMVNQYYDNLEIQYGENLDTHLLNQLKDIYRDKKKNRI